MKEQTEMQRNLKYLNNKTISELHHVGIIMGEFTIRVPDDFLKEFDDIIQRKYATRTEAIRDAMRLLIKQIQEEQNRANP